VRPPSRTVFAAVAFEVGLGLLALGLGGWLDRSPLVWPDSAAAGDHLLALAAGAAAALPLLGILVLLDRHPRDPLRELRRLTDEILPALFRGASSLELLLVSAAAGFGEELLFRGLIQHGLAENPGASGYWGWAVGSLLFGAAHPISVRYACAAALVGGYLGLLQIATGSVLAPMAAHAAYDWGALSYLLSRRPKQNPDQRSSSAATMVDE
jgi:membrane protease YdiL (CAAX protease family)